jgi:AraC-like DNA-binding protein
VARLRAEARGTPRSPLVLVAPRTALGDALGRSLAVDEVVAKRDADRLLLPAISRATGAAYLRDVGARVQVAQNLPVRLRVALAHACHSAEPVTEVADLAGRVGCDRSTLTRQWHRATQPGDAMRLDEVLGWLVLLRAVARRPPGRKWASVATEVGTSERTLARAARQHIGLSLRALTSFDFDALTRAFELRVVSRMMGASGAS